MWEPAAEEALAGLSPKERQACLVVARSALALIEHAVAADGEPTDGTS